MNTVYWTEDRPDEFSLDMARRAGARAGDIVAFGHTHLPWHREIGGIHFLNTGSVGRPKDGDWRARYAAVTSGESGGGNAEFEFVRVEYDLERTEAAILQSELPDEFARILRNGGSL